MRPFLAWTVLACFCGGCAGGYALTAPDCLAPAGGTVPVVVRLQHRELPFFTPPVKTTALRFRLAEGPVRAAQTDKGGYAALSVPAPATPGVYPVNVALQDIEGEEATWDVLTFVWDPRRPIVAVDMDAVVHRVVAVAEARAAMARLAQTANVLYLSDASVATFPKLHQILDGAGLPDGPILVWGQEGWWQWPWWKTKTIASPLGRLREVFPHLETGIAGSRLAVGAFQQAGMRCLLVTPLGGGGEDASSTNWAGLGTKGLP
jgi:hypothetical protein